MKRNSIFSKSIILFVIVTVAVINPGCLSITTEKHLSDATEKQFTILHTNDIHSRVKEGKYAGMGFGKLKALVNEEKKKNPHTLLFDAGDAFSGHPLATITKGSGVVTIMNEIGYDAMAAGNHEFDFGYKRLLELKKKARFSILSANTVYAKNEKRLFPATKIIKKNDVTFGIFGLTTEETAYKTHPNNVKPLKFLDQIETAKLMRDYLKDRVDVIIAVGHTGTTKAREICAKVDGIDLFIDGHSHSTLEKGEWVNDTLIVQAGDHTKNLGKVMLTYSADGKISMEATLLTKKEYGSIAPDAYVEGVIEKVGEQYDEIADTVVAKTDILLNAEKVRVEETNISNLLATTMKMAAQSDFALTNGGGIRSSIDAGNITYGDIITTLPFGNTIVTLELTGQQLKNALAHGISDYPNSGGKFPQVAGLRFEFDDNDKIIRLETDSGIPIEMDKQYLLATNDFLASGGDKYEIFTEVKVISEYGTFAQEFITHIKKYGTKYAVVDGRIKRASSQ